MKRLVVAAALLALTSAHAKEPLNIKGVTIGDTIEKGSHIGAADFCGGGTCMGPTTFGPVPDARFSVSYVGGVVSWITVSFDARYSREILAGLTAKFGAPSGKRCEGDPGKQGCHTWTSGGLTLLLIEDTGKGSGGVSLSRATTEGNY